MLAGVGFAGRIGVGPGATKASKMPVVLMLAQAAGAEDDEIRRGREASGREDVFMSRALGALGAGAIEYVTERLGLGIAGEITAPKLTQIGQSLMRGRGNEVVRLIGESAGVSLANAPEEAAAQILNNIGDRITYDPERDTFEGVGDAALSGALMGPLFGASSSVGRNLGAQRRAEANGDQHADLPGMIEQARIQKELGGETQNDPQSIGGSSVRTPDTESVEARGADVQGRADSIESQPDVDAGRRGVLPEHPARQEGPENQDEYAVQLGGTGDSGVQDLQPAAVPEQSGQGDRAGPDRVPEDIGGPRIGAKVSHGEGETKRTGRLIAVEGDTATIRTGEGDQIAVPVSEVYQGKKPAPEQPQGNTSEILDPTPKESQDKVEAWAKSAVGGFTDGRWSVGQYRGEAGDRSALDLLEAVESAEGGALNGWTVEAQKPSRNPGQVTPSYRITAPDGDTVVSVFGMQPSKSRPREAVVSFRSMSRVAHNESIEEADSGRPTVFTRPDTQGPSRGVFDQPVGDAVTGNQNMLPMGGESELERETREARPEIIDDKDQQLIGETQAKHQVGSTVTLHGRKDSAGIVVGYKDGQYRIIGKSKDSPRPYEAWVRENRDQIDSTDYDPSREFDLDEGETGTTASGRRTTGFPRFDYSTIEAARRTESRINQWLIDNARAEAEARGDDQARAKFSEQTVKTMFYGMRRDMREYLFGKQAQEPATPEQETPSTATGDSGKTVEMPDSINDRDGVVSYIKASGEKDAETLRDIIEDEPHALAVVELRDIQGLELEGANNGLDENKVDELSKKDSDEIIPVVLSRHLDILDGGHRIAAAYKRGDTDIYAYVPESATSAAPKTAEERKKEHKERLKADRFYQIRMRDTDFPERAHKTLTAQGHNLSRAKFSTVIRHGLMATQNAHMRLRQMVADYNDGKKAGVPVGDLISALDAAIR